MEERRTKEGGVKNRKKLTKQDERNTNNKRLW